LYSLPENPRFCTGSNTIPSKEPWLYNTIYPIITITINKLHFNEIGPFKIRGINSILSAVREVIREGTGRIGQRN
jgi:hypothetical protein